MRVLEEVDNYKEAYRLEQKYIKRINTQIPRGYNLDSGGQGGKEVSEETRRKQSKPKSEEHKKKLCKPKSEEAKRNMRKPKSKKAKWNMCKAQKRRAQKEKAEGISRKHSEIAKKNMQKAQLGRKQRERRMGITRSPSAETIEKLRKANIGKRASEKTKEKMRISQKRAQRKRRERESKTGIRTSYSKITDKQAIIIFHAFHDGYYFARDIAQIFGISTSLVHDIANKRTRKYLWKGE